MQTNRHVSLSGQGFVRQAWYVAAYSDELVAGSPRAVTLLEDPIVLFRGKDGAPIALEDRCVHRSLPLSAGRVRDGIIECGYHGMQFDCSGRCVRIPGQSAIPEAARVRRYPVVEQDSFIWVWMGAPDAADRARITPFPTRRLPGWQETKLHARIECNYQLVIDNLLDLSHLSFVHASTVGSPELADDADVTTERFDGGVRVSRWTLNVPPAPTYQQFGKYDGAVDRWQITQFFAPSTLLIRNGSCRAGTGARERGPGLGAQPWEFIVCHGVTPESDRITNYFWVVTHGFGADNPAEVAEFHRQSHQVIGEDIAVFAAQQKMLDRLPDAPILNIRYDAGPIQARRLMQDLLAAERQDLEVQHVPA